MVGMDWDADLGVKRMALIGTWTAVIYPFCHKMGLEPYIFLASIIVVLQKIVPWIKIWEHYLYTCRSITDPLIGCKTQQFRDGSFALGQTASGEHKSQDSPMVSPSLAKLKLGEFYGTTCKCCSRIYCRWCSHFGQQLQCRKGFPSSAD